MCVPLYASLMALEAGRGHLQRQHLDQPWEMCFLSAGRLYTSKSGLFCYTNMTQAEEQYFLSGGSTIVLQSLEPGAVLPSRKCFSESPGVRVPAQALGPTADLRTLGRDGDLLSGICIFNTLPR